MELILKYMTTHVVPGLGFGALAGPREAPERTRGPVAADDSEVSAEAALETTSLGALSGDNLSWSRK